MKRRKGEVGEGDVAPLHGKVSLLAGGNLAHITADAVVNASNHWLTTGKGGSSPHLLILSPSCCMSEFHPFSSLSLFRGERGSALGCRAVSVGRVSLSWRVQCGGGQDHLWLQPPCPACHPHGGARGKRPGQARTAQVPVCLLAHSELWN